MVARLRKQGIQDETVLRAMQAVPRHVFVDPGLASRAYEDSALPIGHSQTISQPYVVARAIALARMFLAESERPTGAWGREGWRRIGTRSGGRRRLWVSGRRPLAGLR